MGEPHTGGLVKCGPGKLGPPPLLRGAQLEVGENQVSGAVLDKGTKQRSPSAWDHQA